MTTITPSPLPQPRLNRYGVRLFVGIAFFTAVQAAIVFLAAGTVRWPAAWAYFGLYIGCYLAGLTWVAAVNPAVINERGRPADNVEAFDQRFHRLMPLLIFGGLLVGGLDHRFGWSAMPLALQIVGLALLIPALFLAVWVLATNAYAARVVRLQDGQQVVTTGPYRYVRHPMYSGTLLSLIAVALSLGSWWMLLPAVAGIVLFVGRTRREDLTLQEKLPGYRDYAQQTRYRLIPGLW
ncbi:MAG: isoprenylcysteine carboxylmethyltransferase family protein [Anaerolineae bacterium]|uniref:methyltransferase family protein n=1 Tax=Promineifilum sp. TaxID=2664178 RepID=UPI001D265E6E|nr:isoprenylcysteine carboxylmethyltransferase family protein [Anaerolineales bacterium]MCO5180136.1 isoprenylcysteine carboxylmethyltransferase family protein [Promineifilum sp.]MCW5847494.1 isoprenylcysteine carboxylmethyltransferase family protein [Anaerolineae bacterium]